MSLVRPAAVAGSFYPGEAAALAAEIANYLADAPPSARVAKVPKAIIAPHAGYMYSGPIAGAIYARLAPLRGTVSRVVLAGPAHRVYVPAPRFPRWRHSTLRWARWSSTARRSRAWGSCHSSR